MLSEEKKMETKKEFEKHYCRLIKKSRWMAKDCKVWDKTLYRKGTSLVVGIRQKPVMYSQLTLEEKKIYHDREKAREEKKR
jgi:hypothetical protein